jgi:hypothetical protein
MNEISQEAFDSFKIMIRTHLQDVSNEQYKELTQEWKTQRNVRREVASAKIKSRLKVGDTVATDNNATTYKVLKINRSKFVGKNMATNVDWNVPISMIEEIL